MIAVDIDGTLLGSDGRVSPRNIAALQAAQHLGIEVVIATGRRHCYAMRVLREVGLLPQSALVSSNGAVIRQVDSTLLERTLMTRETAEWLVGQVNEFRNELVITFDRVGANGEDASNSLVVESFDRLHASIARWMESNAPYIERVVPIEQSFADELPIQMMLCGSVPRMRSAEALLLAHRGVMDADTVPIPGSHSIVPEAGGFPGIALHRTEYPERDLSIVDLLPAGCSKGSALLSLAKRRGITADQILAIGDNWNDLPMLEIAGHAVLMGNAPFDLLPLAPERGWAIGPRHDEDGVAHVLEAVLREIAAAEAVLQDRPLFA